MRLTVSGLKEMIRDEIVHAILEEQRSSVDTAEYLGDLGTTATPDPAVGGEEVAGEMGDQDQDATAKADSAPDPTSPEVQAAHKEFQAEKEGEETTRTADAQAAKEV